MTISYNILNLPEYIQDNWGSGEISHRYSYLADGTKTSVGDYENSGYQYAGSLVYSMDYGTVNSFESASFGGGRIVGTNIGSEVHYFLTDHLGSTRVVAKVTPTGREDLDRKDYYPFGKEWRQPDMPVSDNRYMFSGKERSDICLENDYSSILPIYDFGARCYYPEGVFFLQQDPLMEKYYSIGQYNYCAGNPIKFADHDGRKIVDAKGRVLYQNGQWTKEASGTAAMRVGIAMMATPTGQATFDTIVNNSTNIQIELSQTIKLSDDGSSLIRGEMVPGNIALSDNGQVELLDGEITIFEGSLKAEINGVIGVSDKTSTLIKSLPENIALDGAIGSVAVHEGIHTTKENIQQQYDNIQKNGTNDIEKDPINAQNKYLEELIKKEK